jgi:hypothetical protein
MLGGGEGRAEKYCHLRAKVLYRKLLAQGRPDNVSSLANGHEHCDSRGIRNIYSIAPESEDRIKGF